ncbi:MAG: hypothetical protein WAZ94_08475 [Phycisphaerales bacterium]
MNTTGTPLLTLRFSRRGAAIALKSTTFHPPNGTLVSARRGRPCANGTRRCFRSSRGLGALLAFIVRSKAVTRMGAAAAAYCMRGSRVEPVFHLSTALDDNPVFLRAIFGTDGNRSRFAHLVRHGNVRGRDSTRDIEIEFVDPMTGARCDIHVDDQPVTEAGELEALADEIEHELSDYKCRQAAKGPITSARSPWNSIDHVVRAVHSMPPETTETVPASELADRVRANPQAVARMLVAQAYLAEMTGAFRRSLDCAFTAAKLFRAERDWEQELAAEAIVLRNAACLDWQVPARQHLQRLCEIVSAPGTPPALKARAITQAATITFDYARHEAADMLFQRADLIRKETVAEGPDVLSRRRDDIDVLVGNRRKANWRGLDKPSEGLAMLKEVQQAAERLDEPRSLASIQLSRVSLLIQGGRWGPAVDAFRAAEHLFARGAKAVELVARSAFVYACARAGAKRTAKEQAARVLEEAQRLGFRMPTSYTRVAGTWTPHVLLGSSHPAIGAFGEVKARGELPFAPAQLKTLLACG